MGKPTGFKEFTRQTVPYRNAMDRLIDYKEIYTAPEDEALNTGRALHGLRRAFLSVRKRLPCL